MKLEESVDAIRSLIFKAIDKSLSQMGLMAGKQYDLEKVPADMQVQRIKIDGIISNLTGETGNYAHARAKLIDEFSFTLFNRIAGVKVAETNQLITDIFIRNAVHGGRSFGHKLWLEQNPDKAGLKLDGLREYVRYEFNRLSKRVQLYSYDYLYDMLPDVFDLNAIIEEFNKIEEADWKSDDIMGWMYESYNNSKKKEFKESGEKIEYDKVSLTSQFYTPRWVVKFLVDNSLGKLYLEMYPDSSLKEHHDIANAPAERVREPKPIEEIRLIDPAPGSGNFLLYAFDLFYEMYVEQGYEKRNIPRLIIENNLYGVDIDDRAIQIAQLGLYIKVLRKNRDIRIDKFNIVSTDFYLPEYDAVKSIFEQAAIDKESRELLQSIWEDLRQAYKFGSLVHLEEKVNAKIDQIKEWAKTSIADLTAIQSKWEKWKEGFIPKLKDAVSQFPSERAAGFLKSKTIDSLTFVDILTQKYDVAVANPPYTDSGNYGPQLQQFIKDNYKKPFDFYSNLYACFIKRCADLITLDGKLAMIHPLTFMYIKSFEDVRKFILDKFHINIFVDYGLSNLFGSVMVDPAFYVLEKGKTSDKKSLFISLDQYTRTPQEKYKKEYAIKGLNNYVNNIQDKHLITIDQAKLKLIKSYPFIYWISDEFRNKFKSKSLDDYVNVTVGLQTGNNSRFLRFWWEVDKSTISVNYEKDQGKWVGYTKGGPYNKWYGNLWTVVNWENNGEEIRNIKDENGKQRSRPQNEDKYFDHGITYSASGSKGVSLRYLPPNHIFDVGGSSIFHKKSFTDINYSLAFLNSKLCFYITNCLNPTVNIQVGDLSRIPFVIPTQRHKDKVSKLSDNSVNIKKHLCSFSLVELDHQFNPMEWSKNNTSETGITSLVMHYLVYENRLLTHVLINEAIINEIIFEVYNLSEADKAMVLAKEGIPVGSLPIIPEAREAFLKNEIAEFPLDEGVKGYIQNIPVVALSEEQRQSLIALFPSLYQNNNDLEEFCIKQNINPINVWYLFKNSNVVPSQRAKVVAMELLVDVVRGLLAEDDDGIIPLNEYAGESTLQKRVYDKLIAMGFTNAQYDAFRTLLGKDINDYLENSFFKDLSDHLNLFMYLPKTPFIWHLSSGENQGFDVYISIYKWSRDKLMRLRSVYLEKRESSLKNRVIDLAKNDSDSIKAQSEKETIQKQLAEIQQFKSEIDEILRSGYDPILDDGVGKNIAPLQEKGLLKAEVLNKSQLRKYLNADW